MKPKTKQKLIYFLYFVGIAGLLNGGKSTPEELGAWIIGVVALLSAFIMDGTFKKIKKPNASLPSS